MILSSDLFPCVWIYHVEFGPSTRPNDRTIVNYVSKTRAAARGGHCATASSTTLSERARAPNETRLPVKKKVRWLAVGPVSPKVYEIAFFFVVIFFLSGRIVSITKTRCRTLDVRCTVVVVGRQRRKKNAYTRARKQLKLLPRRLVNYRG